MNKQPRTVEDAAPVAIAQILRRDIETGRYRIGADMPGEAALSRELETSSSTVRRALNQLTAEGWLMPRNGRGTEILPRPDPDTVIPLDPADPWRDIRAHSEPERIRLHVDAARLSRLFNLDPFEPMARTETGAHHTPTGTRVRMGIVVPEESLRGIRPRPESTDPRGIILNALTEAYGPLRRTLDIGSLTAGSADRTCLRMDGPSALVTEAAWITGTQQGRTLLIETMHVRADQVRFQVGHT